MTAHGSDTHSLVGRLLRQFRTRPDATAVEAGGTTLTYAALDRASHLLATRLRADGAGAGRLVGLLTEPGPDTVIGVVAILRAGRAGFRWTRASSRPAGGSAEARRCLHRGVPRRDPVRRRGPRRCADGTQRQPAGHADGRLPAGARPEADADAIAYVIFTSGSTGRPKAVPVTFRAMENYLDWAVGTFGYGAGDRLAQTASPASTPRCVNCSLRSWSAAPW
ncbi:AMP-binding protein [Streptomyces sp. M10(2022)]